MKSEVRYDMPDIIKARGGGQTWNTSARRWNRGSRILQRNEAAGAQYTAGFRAAVRCSCWKEFQKEDTG